MKNRRAFQRASVELPAFYSVVDDWASSFAEQLTHQATVINISAGGFCFYAQQKLPDGTAVSLNIEVERGKELCINAKTAWSKKIRDKDDFMIGVEIDQASGTDLEKFLSFYCKEISQLMTDLQNIKEN